jgi:hypothetical protein
MNPQPFPAYLQQLSAALKAGNATEHTHRPALKTLNEDIAWAVDEAAELLARSDIAAILQDFGQRTRQEDPVVHFYQTFLAAYDPALRETRGVYYTPEPARTGCECI